MLGQAIALSEDFTSATLNHQKWPRAQIILQITTSRIAGIISTSIPPCLLAEADWTDGLLSDVSARACGTLPFRLRLFTRRATTPHTSLLCGWRRIQGDMPSQGRPPGSVLAAKGRRETRERFP